MKLTEKAMLVRQSIQSWTGRKFDAVATNKIHQAEGAQADAGRYTKALVSRHALRDLSRIVSAARAHHYQNTLPWEDWGARLLPASRYFDYINEQRQFKQQFEQAAAKFCTNYSAYVDEARVTLGGLFRESDYPSASDIKDKFSFEFVFLPLPEQADFRVHLGEAEEARVRNDIESHVQEMLKRATQDIWARAYKVVSHMQTRLADTDAGFHKTLVGNIQELADLLPSLNIMDDPELAQLAKEMKQELCQYEPQTLRDDAEARKRTAAKAQSILDSMAGYIGN